MRLVDYMRWHGVTDEALAKHLGCSVHAVIKYRRFARTPPPERMLAIEKWSKGRVALADWVKPAHEVV